MLHISYFFFLEKKRFIENVTRGIDLNLHILFVVFWILEILNKSEILEITKQFSV